MAITKDEILEGIKALPVVELASLVKDLEEEFTSFEKKENSEEDELEIPAFLRRQKN